MSFASTNQPRIDLEMAAVQLIKTRRAWAQEKLVKGMRYFNQLLTGSVNVPLTPSCQTIGRQVGEI